MREAWVLLFALFKCISCCFIASQSGSFTLDNTSVTILRNPSHSPDVSFIVNTTVVDTREDIMPLLSVFVRSGTAYLTRFFFTIDFPVHTLLIVQDSLDDNSVDIINLIHSFRRVCTPPGEAPNTLKHNQRHLEPIFAENCTWNHFLNFSHSDVPQGLLSDSYLNPFVHNVQHVVNMPRTGCAQAWNTVFRVHPNQPFWILASNDIAFMRGGLRAFYLSTRHDAKTNESIGMTSTAVDFGNHLRRTFGLMLWSNTRQGILRVGLYDENFFPAYFEDDDIIWRHWIAGMLFKTYAEIAIRHGEGDGYHTGTMKEDKTGALRAEVDRSLNFRYLQHKWGRDMQGVNHTVIARPGERELFLSSCGQRNSNKYCTPFQFSADRAVRLFKKHDIITSEAMHPVSFWTYFEEPRRCVLNRQRRCDRVLQTSVNSLVRE